MQVTIAKSFFTKMDKLSLKVEEVVKAKATEIVTDVVDLSPVDTGAFVESWQINPSGDRTSRARSSAGRTSLPAGAKQAKREEEKARLLTRVASFDMDELRGFTITNRAPHIPYIEQKPFLKTGIKPSEIGAILRNKYT